jgi:hypothetical protein
MLVSGTRRAAKVNFAGDSLPVPKRTPRTVILVVML